MTGKEVDEYAPGTALCWGERKEISAMISPVCVKTKQYSAQLGMISHSIIHSRFVTVSHEVRATSQEPSLSMSNTSYYVKKLDALLIHFKMACTTLTLTLLDFCAYIVYLLYSHTGYLVSQINTQ